MLKTFHLLTVGICSAKQPCFNLFNQRVLSNFHFVLQQINDLHFAPVLLLFNLRASNRRNKITPIVFSGCQRINIIDINRVLITDPTNSIVFCIRNRSFNIFPTLVGLEFAFRFQIGEENHLIENLVSNSLLHVAPCTDSQAV